MRLRLGDTTSNSLAEARAIISLDRGFANILRHPPQATAGIIVIRLHTQTLPLVRQAAERLCKLLADESVRVASGYSMKLG